MIKNYTLTALLVIGVLVMAGFTFPVQDEILALLNARDTLTNVIGFVCLPLWWVLVGVYEYTLIRLIYKQIKNK